jgi:hypothetical protein
VQPTPRAPPEGSAERRTFGSRNDLLEPRTLALLTQLQDELPPEGPATEGRAFRLRPGEETHTRCAAARRPIPPGHRR